MNNNFFIDSDKIDLYLAYFPESFKISKIFNTIGIIPDRSYLPSKLPTSPANQRGPTCGIASAHNQIHCNHYYHHYHYHYNYQFHQHYTIDQQKKTSSDNQYVRQNSNLNLKKFKKNGEYHIIPQRKKAMIHGQLMQQGHTSIREIIKTIEIKGEPVSQTGEIYDHRVFKILFSEILGFEKVTVFQSNPNQYISDLCNILTKGHTVTTSVNSNKYDTSPAIKDNFGYGAHWITIYGYITTKSYKIYFIVSQYGKYFLFDADNLKKSNDNLINTNIPFQWLEKSNRMWHPIDISKKSNTNECKKNNKELRKLMATNYNNFHHAVVGLAYPAENLFKDKILFPNNIQKTGCTKPIYDIHNHRKILFEFQNHIYQAKDIIINYPECINYRAHNKEALVVFISYSKTYREEIFIDYLKVNPDKKFLLTTHVNHFITIDYIIKLNNKNINKQLIKYIKNTLLTILEKKIILLSAIIYSNYDIKNLLNNDLLTNHYLNKNNPIIRIDEIKNSIDNIICHIKSGINNPSYPNKTLEVLKKMMYDLKQKLTNIKFKLADEIGNNNDNQHKNFNTIHFKFNKKLQIDTLLNNLINEINNVLIENRISIVDPNNTSKLSL